MRWLRKLSRLFPGSSLKVYDDINDLPVSNWMKVHQTQNLAHIYRLRDYSKLPEVVPALINAWRKMYNQYIKEFGLNSEYAEYLDTMRRIAIMKCDLVITGDRTLETLIEVEEMELKAMTKEREPFSFIDVITAIERHLHFRIDPTRLSTMKYYAYLRDMRKTYEALKRSWQK